MPWYVTKIKDCGRGRLYRWYVEGLNTEVATPATFAWVVQNVADERYQPAADASDETLRGLLVAKVICEPPTNLRPWANMTAAEILAALEAAVDTIPDRPCLACAREEQASAGFPGIDREQRGHTCRAYLLNGEPVDVDDFVRANSDPDAPGLSPDQVQEIRHMAPGDRLLLGGGAGETFTLTRTR
jgi:hypothetical protein